MLLSSKKTFSFFISISSVLLTHTLFALPNQLYDPHTLASLTEKRKQERCFALQNIEEISKNVHDPLIQKAALAAKKMSALQGTHISPEKLFKIACFIETRLPRYVLQGKYYFKRSKTGLARTIEYDPETKHIFIHLKCHNGLKPLGRGYFKTVTKSILYSHNTPEVVAHTEQTGKEEREVKLLKKIVGLKGLVQLKAAMIKKDQSGRYTTSLIFPLYAPGALSHALVSKLSSKEKYTIARQVLEGLKGLHEKKIIHRDIKLDNIFIERRGALVTAVLSDLGQAYPENKARGMKPHDTPCYMPPEGFLPSYNHINYQKSDTFSLGWVFYELIFVKKPSWMSTSGLFEVLQYGSSEQKHAMQRALIQEIKRAQIKLKTVIGSATDDIYTKKVAKAAYKMLEADAEKRPSLDTLLTNF